MTQQRQWFALANGKTVGPFSDEQLLDFATAGRIKPRSRIRSGDGDWIDAAELGWLFPDASLAGPKVATPATDAAPTNDEGPIEFAEVERPPISHSPLPPVDRGTIIRHEARKAAAAGLNAAATVMEVLGRVALALLAIAVTVGASVSYGPLGFISAMMFFLTVTAVSMVSDVREARRLLERIDQCRP